MAIMGVNGGLMPAQSLVVPLVDRRAPSFEASLAADEGLTWLPHGSVLLRYDELVFGSGDDGKVSKYDLIVEISGNATLANISEQEWDGSSTAPTTPTTSSGTSGGRRRLRTGTGSWQSAFTLVLRADASESVSVSLIPKPNSIFDANGNAMLSQRTVSASVVVPTAGPLLGMTAAAPVAAPAAALAIGALVAASFALLAAAEVLRRRTWLQNAKKLQEELKQLQPLMTALDTPGDSSPELGRHAASSKLGASSTYEDFQSLVSSAIRAEHSLRVELDIAQGLEPPSGPTRDSEAYTPSQAIAQAALPARPSIIEVAHSVAPSSTDRLAVEKLLAAMEAARQSPISSQGGGVRGTHRSSNTGLLSAA